MQNVNFFYLLLIFLFFPSGLIYAQEPIKSASEYDYPPFSIVTQEGEADGFSVELLRASLKAVGLDVKFDVGPWAKIKQDLIQGKIQVLPLVGRTPGRENIFDFSVPYKTMYGGIFVRTDQTRINTLKDLANKEILVMKGDSAEEFLLRENVSKHLITTESFEQAFKLLSKGNHDAIVVQQAVGKQLIKKLGITNVIYKSRIDQYKQDWTFAVKEGDKELLASLNDGLSTIITNGTFDKIHDKWFTKIKAEKKRKAQLTPQENAFIKSHPIITLGTDESWAPYTQKARNGVLTGIDSEIIRLINQYTGTNIQLKTGKWADMVDKAQNHSIDGLSTSTVSKKREQYFAFTDRYISDYLVVVTPLESTLMINKLGDFTGKILATQEGNIIIEKLAEKIPDVKIIQSTSAKDAVGLILEGRADACILSASIFPIQNRDNSGTIKVSYVARELPIDLVFSIRKDWPQLVSIINKGLDTISEHEMNIIYNKWFEMPKPVEETFPEKKEHFSHAKRAIKQKAEDVARQIEIYLNAFPDKTLKDLQNDPEFQKIAIQPVGTTGYTVVADYNNLVILFHPSKNLTGIEIESLSKKYPVLWELAEQTRGGHDVAGIYEFPDLNGVIKKKYSYRKTIKKKTADGVGMWVGATTYLDEYETIEVHEAKNDSFPILPVIWVLGVLIFVIFLLLILHRLNIVKLEKNVIMLLLAIALLLIIGLFIFNAYNITKNLKKSAIENYYDTLSVTASVKHVHIKQHISHLKNTYTFLSSRKTYSNEDLMEIVKLGEDFNALFIIGLNGRITHSSDISHIGMSRLADPYFKTAKKGIYIKPLYSSGNAGNVLFTISIPLNKSILSGIMNLNQIHEIISQKDGLGESGESLLAYRNENGDAVFFTERRFTADAESRDIIPKEDINIPITQALLKNEKKFSNYVDYRGVPVFAVTKYLHEIDAGLVVKIDQKEVLQSVSKNINQIWYSSTVMILAIIIVSIIFYFLLTYSLRKEIKNKTDELEKAYQGLSKNITQLQNSEKKLRESEEQVRNIFDNSSIVHYSHNIDHVVTYVSPQIENILGYTPEEAMVKWTELVSDNPINAISLENTQKAIDTGERQPVYELEFIHKNGKKVYAEAYESPVVKNGKTISIIGSFADITERKKAAEKIARFGRIFEDSLNEIFMFDTVTLKFIQVNPAGLHNLGYTMEELEKLTVLDIKPEMSAESFAKLTAPLINEETQKTIFETVHKRKDKSLYDVEVHLQLLKHEHNSLFTAIIVDITNRKQAEKEKIQLEAQYRQAQKMESIGRLAGGVAHDFNNALSVITGFTEFAVEDADPKSQLHEDLTEVLTASKRAADITRQLLAFARKQIISPKMIDLNETVESMLKMIRRLIGEDIDLAWMPGADLWSVKMDPSQIDQLLVNLCVNSRDAIKDVGRITIETNTTVFDSAYCAENTSFTPGEFVMLSVSDNGCGMDKEIQDSIFEPFFTTKDMDKGTGLGLATVYGIVKQNNGFINIYSEPDKGTTIKIYLPRHKEQKVEIQKISTTEILLGHGETILLVEDDLSILKLVEKTLKGLDYTILTACTPVEAIDLVREHSSKIDLLVTDVIMPEMNGRKLSERLQSQYPDLKCIFMSGYTANAIAHHGVLDEGMEFIQKPFSKTDLAKIVRKVLGENKK